MLSTSVMLNDNLFSHIFAPFRCVLFLLMPKMKKHVSHKKNSVKTDHASIHSVPNRSSEGGWGGGSGWHGGNPHIWHCTSYVSVKVTNQCFNGF